MKGREREELKISIEKIEKRVELEMGGKRKGEKGGQRKEVKGK